MMMAISQRGKREILCPQRTKSGNPFLHDFGLGSLERHILEIGDLVAGQ